jgi:hypothetical protein
MEAVMAKFDILDRSEPAFNFSTVEPSTHTEGALESISSNNGGDGIPSDTPLSVDAIISYCESQLRNLDSQIVDDMAQASNGADGHGGSGNDAQIDMLELQSHMGQRQEVVQLTTEILQAGNSETAQTITHIGDGDDNRSASAASSAGDHASGWPSEINDVHHASPILDGGRISGAEISMIDLQSVVSARENAVQLATQMLQSLNNAAQSIINNIDGGGHGNSAEGGGSSAGNHPPGWPFNSTGENGAGSGNHAHMDALSTVHIANAHVATEPSHSFESGLDFSHLTAHF